MKKYYYIEKAVGPIPEIRNNQTIGYHQVLKVIPTNDTVEFNTTYNRPEPIIKVLNDVVDLLKNKMKVEVEILTAEQIAKMPEISENAKAFIKMLPLTLSMEELNGNEKYHYLDKPLPTDSSRVESISCGDLMLYGSDCIVLFYKKFSTPYSYTKIGKVNDPEGLEQVLGKGSVTITFQIK